MLHLIMQKIYGILEHFHEVRGQIAVYIQIRMQQNMIQQIAHQLFLQFMETKMEEHLFMHKKKVLMMQGQQ